jgi:hypothetical protein
MSKLVLAIVRGVFLFSPLAEPLKAGAHPGHTSGDTPLAHLSGDPNHLGSFWIVVVVVLFVVGALGWRLGRHS